MTTSAPILALALGLLVASAAQASGDAPRAKGQDAGRRAKDETACKTWATQQTGYDPASPPPQAQARVEEKTGAKGATDKGKKFLGKIPVTTLIGGPKSIAMSAAAGLAGSQLAKSGGVVGGAASGAANVMGKVPIPTTQEVVGAAHKTVGGKKSDASKGDPAAYEKARATCLSGKGYAAN